MSRPTRIHSRFLVLGILLAAGFCALWSSAVARAESIAFAYTGAEQTFVVPANVTSIRAIAIGGRGGAGVNGGNGGFGAMASADLAVTPGQTLYIEVGGNAAGLVGGFNGGAAGGDGASDGGGGGGASDIRTAPRALGVSLNLRLIVAGGGGGGGGTQGSPAEKTNHGGNGGAVAGAGGNDYGFGGGPGTTAAGGAAGTGFYGGSPGAIGIGGTGGVSGYAGGGSGGGGGGGVFGGGGGGGSSAGGGGGAGASGFGAGASNGSVVTDVTGSPSILLTYTANPPGPPVVEPEKLCVVPNLSGRKMKGARKALRNRGCKVGKVTRRTPRASRVVAQSPKAGKKLPAGTKVDVTLGGRHRN